MNRLNLLPPGVFADHLPDALVRDYLHFYNHETDGVEFRLRKHPWTAEKSASSWRLRRNGSYRRLARGDHVLVNRNSSCARTTSEIVDDLEGARHVHTLYDINARRIDIKLPRLKLDFFISEGENAMYSRQY